MDKQRLASLGVGILFLVALVTLLFMSTITSNNITFSSQYYQLQAKFTNIGSLVNGAPVKIAGVTIGIVDSISLDNSQQKAIVSMLINKNYRINTDATVQIVSAGIFGEQYLNIVMGTEYSYLSNHQAFLYTNSAFILENLITRMIGNNFIK
jgi:phospholipid/cholesterol/gamma-HCH transport system substrate-binding protein